MMATPEFIIERILNGERTAIPNRPPSGFDPQQYIYRRLSFNCRRMNLDYQVLGLPTKKNVHNDFGDVVQFCKNIIRNAHIHKGDDREEDKALDVTISRHSYVIFELPKGWTFSPLSQFPGIMLGGANPDVASYGELRYVTDASSSATPIPNCRIVYFSALNKDGTDTDPYKQPFNFNIVMPDGIAVLVDPDIRFPGNAVS